MFGIILGMFLGYVFQVIIVTIVLLVDSDIFKTKKEFLYALHPLFLGRLIIRKYESLKN